MRFVILLFLLPSALYAGEPSPSGQPSNQPSSWQPSSQQPSNELPDYPSVPNFGELNASIVIQQAQAYKPEPRTNGEVIKNGKDYIVVDNKKQPTCVFYLNYSATTGQVTQYADVDYVNLNCEK